MKRFLLLMAFIAAGFATYSQTNTWTGGVTGNWSAAANWSLVHYPTTAEDVVINTTTTIIFDLAASITNINSLSITNSANVALSCFNGTGGGSRTLQLASTSSPGDGLIIETGSTLTMNAANNSGTGNWVLGMTGATGVLGVISGTLQFTGTGTGTGAAQLDLYKNASANAHLIVSASGKIIYLPNSGNTSSAAGSYLNMQNGSVYEIKDNGGTFPEGNWEANSIAKATNTGNTCPKFNGSVYGNLEWSMPGQNTTLSNYFNKNLTFNNVNIITTNSAAGNGDIRITTGASALPYTLTINGNLDIGANARLVLTSATVTAGNGGTLLVKGNINNQGTLTTNGIAGTINELQIAGTALQTFSNTGVFSGAQLLFTMLNPAGLTLLSPVILPGNANFSNGKINTTATNILAMIDNATYTGGSVNSFVSGPMKKIGNDNFLFPVGKGNIYQRIGITNVAGQAITDAFTAEYIRTNPQSIHGIAVESGQDHVSLVEYWSLIQNIGASPKLISLDISFASFCYDLTKTYVSHWNNTVSYWANEGATNVAGPSSSPFVSGTITSSKTINTFGDFTLVTDLPPVLNPLPVKLISFTAVKVNNAVSVFNWDLETNNSAGATFEIEKSLDNNTFNSFAVINGNKADRHYNFIDNQLAAGTTWYRLKVTDADKTITYSKTVIIINKREDFLTNIFPNPVVEGTTVIIKSSKKATAFFQLYNFSGSNVKQWQENITEGSNKLNIDGTKLSPGMYYLQIITGSNKETIRFIKQ